MTKYFVQLYRKMRLSYVDIEADTPQAAAAIASRKTTDDADNVEDCEGEDLAALVDVPGDDTCRQSVTIDFEPERQRKAAPVLLAALQGIIEYAENEAYALEKLKDGPNAEAEAEKAWNVLESARAAITGAKAADTTPGT